MRITANDRHLIRWLCAVQASTYEQLAAATGRSVDSLRHRLPHLHRHGLVDRRLEQTDRTFTTRWFPTPAAAKKLQPRQTRTQPAPPDQVDTDLATLLNGALLPYYDAVTATNDVYTGTALAKKVDSLWFGWRLRDTAGDAPREVELTPFPDALVTIGRTLIAVEVRRGNTAEDWPHRLLTYRHLGVTHLDVHADATLATALLHRAASCTPGIVVRTTRLPV